MQFNTIDTKEIRMAFLKKSAIRNEQGFAFIAALLAMLILVSLGVLIFALTTKDLTVAIRLMGEKKAFSAAENGIHRALQKFDPLASTITTGDQACPGLGGYFQVNSTTDNATCYSFTYTPAVWPSKTGSSTVNMAGYSITGSQNFGRAPYDSGVTGTNTKYMSQVSIDFGMGYGPVDSSLPGYR
jgi:Tfp pilus assembly protein PilX